MSDNELGILCKNRTDRSTILKSSFKVSILIGFNRLYISY